MINAIPIDLDLLSIKSVCEFIDSQNNCNFYFDYQDYTGYCTFNDIKSMTSFCIGLASLLELIARLNTRL